MVEIHVVRAENRHLYDQQLDQFYRVRHDIYVKERGWIELERPDGREIDQFDGHDATYLIALSGDEVVGGHRFHPTTEPTLLSEVFPHMCSRKLRADSGSYETTRIFVAKNWRGDRAEPRVESLLLAGTMEYALAEGMDELRFLMETWWIPRFSEIGWRLRPLGMPADIAGMNCIAVSVEVEEETWAATCGLRNVPGRILKWRGVEPLGQPMRGPLSDTEFVPARSLHR